MDFTNNKLNQKRAENFLGKLEKAPKKFNL